MASIRGIRKRHQVQMAVTIGMRKVLASYGPWLEFPSMAAALSYLDGTRCEPDGRLSPQIHGDGSGVALSEIAS